MEKVTYKYVNRKIWGREYSRTEVEDFVVEAVDPSEITNFYFSEQTVIIGDDGEKYYGEEKSCSPTYYIGVRLSFDEVLNSEECKQQKNFCEYIKRVQKSYPNASICKTDFGYYEVMYHDDDITVEEYKSNKLSL